MKIFMWLVVYKCIDIAYSLKIVNNTFVIGGKQIYQEALNHPDLRNMYLTLLKGNFNCTTKLEYSLSDFEKIYQSEVDIFDDKIIKDNVEVQCIT